MFFRMKKGSVNKDVIHNIVEQVKRLTDMRKQVILVSSGAGICGVGAINKWSRRGRYQLQAGIVRHRSGGTHDGV